MNNLTRVTLPQVLMRLLFVVLPTLVLAWLTLQRVSSSFTALDTGIVSLALYFGSGLTIAYVLYLYRVRFIVTYGLVLLVFFFIRMYINRLPGEFDVFYASVRFWLFSFLFLQGWIAGFILARFRLASLIIAGAVLFLTIVSFADAEDVRSEFRILAFLPPLAYALYMIFMSGALADALELNGRKALRLAVRLVVFLLLVITAFWISNSLIGGKAAALQQQINRANGKDSTGSDSTGGGGGINQAMLERKSDGTSAPQDSASMDQNGGGNGQDPLMFCARLNSFFPTGEPMPLYFTFHHLTKYDQATETFTRDSRMPLNDEFMPDPSAIPLYHIKSDSVILNRLKQQQKRSVVSADVYITDKTWKQALLAPSTAYSCQSIPADKDYRKTFLSGYRVRSYASDLLTTFSTEKKNEKPYLARAQREAVMELMNVQDYEGVDPAFLKYYTKYPQGPLYDSIRALAIALTANAKTPMEKVAIIHDYFMSKDETGKPLFKYSLKAGKPDDPNIPTGTMLGEFLFHSHKGYCTFFAGATTLMLQSINIPARFTVGFATIDRSDKNKGWYWFYAHQAHAWTQVYFPEYGWLDFDTTIGDEDMKESPAPDGTPPLPPPPPYLVLDGIVEETPTKPFQQVRIRYTGGMLLDHAVLLDAETTHDFLTGPTCLITLNDKDTTLQAAHQGDTVVVVAYRTDQNSDAKAMTDAQAKVELKQLKNPFQADEIHLRVHVPEKKTNKAQKRPNMNKASDWTMLWWILGGFGLFVLLNLFLVPLHIYFFLRFRAKSARTSAERADRIYRLSMYFMHQTLVERGSETPSQYAAQKIDPKYDLNFSAFMQLVQRLKYSGQGASETDLLLLCKYFPTFIQRVQHQLGFFRMYARLLNPARAHRFFRRPAEAHEPEQPSPVTPDLNS